MMKRLARICLWQLLLVALVGLLMTGVPAWAVDDNGDDEQVGTAPRLLIEPIAGLTTSRHLAPASTAFPLGKRLDFFLSVALDAEVSFVGATITSRDATGVSAFCAPNQEGPVTVFVTTQFADGSQYVNACQLNVLRVPMREIRATTITPTVAPVLLDEDSNNMDTMAYFFGDSVARLVEVAPAVPQVVSLDGRQSGSLVTSTPRYRTSTGRRIEFEVVADPPGFAPLMEWRIGGAAVAIGGSAVHTFSDIGDHIVSVGPPRRSADAEIETYRVTITSHRDQVDIITEGQQITFEAETDPPGLEGEITWLSSTKYGTAAPVIGDGPTFTVQFNDTFGLHEVSGERFQWIGVRADNAVFGQDQKPKCFDPADDCWTTASCATDAGKAVVDFCPTPIPADFFGAGSLPFTAPLELGGAAGPGQFDTRMRRTDQVCLLDGEVGVTALEIVELNLESCAPIIVGGTPVAPDWDVKVDLGQARAEDGDISVPNDLPDCSNAGPGEQQKTATLTLPNCGQVSNMRVALQVTHPRVGDLVVELLHIDSGTTVTLMNRPGSNNPGGGDGNLCTGDENDGNENANLDVVFDDSDADLIDDQNGPLDTGESFKPTDLLSAFEGLRWCGPTLSGADWELTITDGRGSNLVCSDGTGSCAGLLVGAPCSDLSGICEFVPDTAGSLDSWTLDFDASPPAAPGTMSISLVDEIGGTFVSSFFVRPRLTFTSPSAPDEVRVLDMAVEPGFPALDLSITEPAGFSCNPVDPPDACDPLEPRNFYPGVGIPAAPEDPQCCVEIGHSSGTPGHLHVTGYDCDGCMGACCLADADADGIGECIKTFAVIDFPVIISSARNECVNTPGLYMGDGTDCLDLDNDGIEDVFEKPRPPGCCDPPQNVWSIPTDPDNPDTDGDGHCDGCEVRVLGTSPCDTSNPDTVASIGCADCNGNMVCDECDVFLPCGVDCNQNGVPDDCEPDGDLDGVIDDCDNCPLVSNADQTDGDGDDFGAACDCDDNEPLANPGLSENIADGNCADGIDNDCDGNTDAADPDC